MKRLLIALSAYGAIALLALWLFPEKQFRYPVIGLMALFAFKSIMHRRETLHDTEAAMSGDVEDANQG
ncbi:MAG: hypothetical protein M3P27_08270 [Acidobacteriota bacterium]|nr:hypothetical protein [Acidobacteriota bacterium]